MKLVTINGLYKKAFGKLKIADNGVLLNTVYTVHLPNWRQEFLCIFFTNQTNFFCSMSDLKNFCFENL